MLTDQQLLARILFCEKQERRLGRCWERLREREEKLLLEQEHWEIRKRNLYAIEDKRGGQMALYQRIEAADGQGGQANG